MDSNSMALLICLNVAIVERACEAHRRSVLERAGARHAFDM